MMTLRELHDHSGREFDPLLCAQILMAVLRAPIVPMSPDDVIADPDRDVFEVRRSDSGDMSFASPQVMMEGREPTAEDRLYAVGLLIHYIWSEEFEDLAVAARMPFIRLYAVNDGGQSPVLRDAQIAENPQCLKKNVMLGWAVALTGGDKQKRAQADEEIKNWILEFKSVFTICLKEGTSVVGELEHDFAKTQHKRVQIRAGNVVSCKGVKYRLLQNEVVEFRPGEHRVEIAVERVR